MFRGFGNSLAGLNCYRLCGIGFSLGELGVEVFVRIGYNFKRFAGVGCVVYAELI